MKMLKIAQVADKVALGRSKIYELVKAGEFPQPVKLTPRSSAWVEAEIDEWLEAKAKERDNPEA